METALEMGMLQLVTAVLTTEPQPVMRVRDAAVIAHRIVRTFSGLRSRGPAGAFVSIAAYPIEWFAYFALICLQASNTVHSGVASAIVPNPVGRPIRRLWSGLALTTAMVIGIGELLAHAQSGLRVTLYGVGVLCFASWAIELVAGWHPGHKPGSLKSTVALLRSTTSGPVVRGESFAAWPQRSGQFGPLLDAVVAELARDGVTLVVEADNDELAQTYMHHGGIRPDANNPRHIAWLAA